jgi:Cu-processing system permease protein
MNPKSIYTVAKKEFTDHIRNRWILILIIIFITLTLASSYLAGQQTNSDTALGGIQLTVIALLSIAQILIPLIAVMLGFATIAGEAESGSLALVLSYPLHRSEVLLGKYLGLGAILAFTSLIGFGIGGLIITLLSGTEQILSYIVFIGLSILLSLACLSPILFFSAILKRRITAMGAGIFLFFWTFFIYNAITLGVYFATSKPSTSQLINQPAWIWWAQAFNPSDLFESAVYKTFNATTPIHYAISLPNYAQMSISLLFMFLWIIIPLFLAYRFFLHRDI